MSAYGVNKFCYRLAVDPSHRALVRDDLEAALDPFELTARERRAIGEGDVGWLFEIGANPMLLVRLFAASVGGLTEQLYSERMRRWADARGVR